MNYKKVILIFAVMLLAACGDNGSSGGASNSDGKSSIGEAILKLEAEGKLPTLDRTDTLAGIDENNNGVRDDIERYVAALPDTPEQKKQLLALSKATTASMLVDLKDKTALRTTTAELDHAVLCVQKEYSPEKGYNKLLEIQKITVNTRSRYEAYMKFNSALGGTVFSLPDEVICE